MAKRVAEKQITKDNHEASSSEDDQQVDAERGKASEEVLATRKILTVKRGAAKDTTKADLKLPEAPKSPKSPKKEAGGLFAGLSGLSALESKAGSQSPKSNLFGGLSGLATQEKKADKSPKGLFANIGASDQSDKSTGGLFSSLFNAPADNGSLFTSSSFSFAAADQKGGLFGAPAAGEASTAFPSFGESPEASEEEEEEQEPEPAGPAGQADELEGEKQIYQSDCKLFKLTKENEKADSMKWIEKCIGFVRLLKNEESGAIRLVVRMKGVYRLALNIALVDKLCRAEKVGNKSVRFNGIDEDGSLGMFRLNLLTEDQQTAFLDQLPGPLKQ